MPLLQQRPTTLLIDRPIYCVAVAVATTTDKATSDEIARDTQGNGLPEAIKEQQQATAVTTAHSILQLPLRKQSGSSKSACNNVDKVGLQSWSAKS
jgi:hypothetical protein